MARSGSKPTYPKFERKLCILLSSGMIRVAWICVLRSVIGIQFCPPLAILPLMGGGGFGIGPCKFERSGSKCLDMQFRFNSGPPLPLLTHPLSPASVSLPHKRPSSHLYSVDSITSARPSLTSRTA
jgi:hypothetical protein